MIRFIFVIIGFFVFNFSHVLATTKVANDPVFIRINNQEITLSEFVHAYQKNNSSMLATKISPEEYLELFINFKLKVTEALALGLDTVPAFVKELAGYREQLAKPYFSDQQVIEDLISEAYDRMQYDVRASHVMIRVDAQASPADTLAAWYRANTIRQRIVNGEPFEKVASEESDDLNAREREVAAGRPPIKGNGGDLGYFSVFNMVYPFETVAFNLAVGEVSQPVRSDFGYHVITVTDHLPAMGRGRVAHVMAMFTQDMDEAKELELKQRIQAALEKYNQGQDFAMLVNEYSDDMSSKGNNGELRPFGSREMVPEFIKAISQMQPGQVSGPIRTNFGWHIIKLLEKDPPPPFEEAYNLLKTSVMQDSRSFLGEQSVVDRLKKEYNFKVNEVALRDFFNLVDSTIFAARWKADMAHKLQKVLFSFDGLDFIQQDFADFLEGNQANRPPGSIEGYVRSMLDEMAKRKLLEHENDLLVHKFPEFKAIVNEYHDGMLLFELTNQKVWTRAIQDTLGLEEFFKANRSNYLWPKRVNARIFSFDNNSEANSFNYELNNALSKTGSYQELLESKKFDEQPSFATQQGIFQSGQNKVIDNIDWRQGISTPFELDDKFYIVDVIEVLPPGFQELDEVRGYVINDYQNFLDQKWIAELRNKYQIVVNNDLLQTIPY